MKKVVVKVNVNSDRHQQCIFNSISHLSGIKEMSVDREKGTLTVTGTADPVCIMKRVKKREKCAKLDSVGDPPKSDEQKKKEEEEKKKKEEEERKKKEEEERKKLCHWICPPPCPPPCPPCPPYTYPYPYCIEEPSACVIQ